MIENDQYPGQSGSKDLTFPDPAICNWFLVCFSYDCLCVFFYGLMYQLQVFPLPEVEDVTWLKLQKGEEEQENQEQDQEKEAEEKGDFVQLNYISADQVTERQSSPSFQGGSLPYYHSFPGGSLRYHHQHHWKSPQHYFCIEGSEHRGSAVL